MLIRMLISMQLLAYPGNVLPCALPGRRLGRHLACQGLQLDQLNSAAVECGSCRQMQTVTVNSRWLAIAIAQ